MSGYPSSHNGTQDASLDQLFSQMRQRNSSAQSKSNDQGYAQQASPYFGAPEYHHPSVSSPIPQPPVGNEPPRHTSAVMSPSSEYPTSHRQTPSFGAPANPNAAHTNSLLSLLKFSSPTTSAPLQPSPIAVPHRASSSSNSNAANLMATLMGANNPKENEALSMQLKAANGGEVAEDASTKAKEPSADTQAYLLQLLNRPKPAQSESSAQIEKAKDTILKTSSPSARGSTPVDVVDLVQTLRETSLGKGSQSPTPSKSSQGLFTYVNPFEELAASSPRHRTPKPSGAAPTSSTPPVIQILKAPRNLADTGDLKRKIEARSPVSSPAHSKAKLSPTIPSPLAENLHQGEASASSKETVSEALNELGSHIDKEVEHALARAEGDDAQAKIEKDLRHMLDARSKSEFVSNAQVAAAAIKEQLEKAGNEEVLQDSLPAPVADAVKDIVDELAQGNMPDSWESEETPSKDDETIVKVYNFPMKPWISITVHPEDKHQLSLFKDDEIFDVARLKKEFDQVDRTLVTASSGFVVYGMSKNGGMRVIRQLDGKDMKLFEETRDRVFNVSISTSSSSPDECAIGTGVSGTVYWADLRAADGEYTQDTSSNPNNHGFALPPIHSPGEETSGGMLKTRARKSSSHPEFFAVGRGKSIHIIWPAVIIKQSYLKHGKERLVDTDKYLQHQSLKINTGKAGKDFIFSQDDTTIVSLDKAGRVKFWDVQTLTNTTRGADPRIPTPEQIQPVEIKEPIMGFNTTRENTKAWPTSVQFIDKLRPYQKGGPLRYLLVGMKQNHTLQLWDLVLRRAVQEIKLPHEKESDAVCSIAYHPNTGILAVGHPTRNSIFFIHVSAPKYDAPKTCSQAEFMQRLANKDPSIGTPKSTAVMSGIREYSFGAKGQLRSLDMLQVPTTVSEDPENPVLFELYTMHSKGITYLAIKQDDMGWNKDSRVMVPLDASDEGIISVETLKEVPNHEPVMETPSPKPVPARTIPVLHKEPGRESTEPARKELLSKATTHPHGDSSAAPATEPRTISPGKVATKTEMSPTATVIASQDAAPVVDKVEKVEKSKKRKEKKASANHAASASKDNSTVAAPSSGIDSSAGTNSVSSSAFSIHEAAIDSIIKRVEASVTSEIQKVLATSNESLVKRIDTERRTHTAQGYANQEAIIRLVASTLNDNIGKKMAEIVGASITSTVLPSISQVASKTLTDQLNQQLNNHLRQNVGKEIRAILPDAVTKSLHQADVLKLMSEALANGVQFKVEEQFASLMKKTVIPTFTQVAAQAANQAAAEIQRAANEQIDRQVRESEAKIDKLTQVITSLAEMVSSMAATQSGFQDRFLELQKQALESSRPAIQTPVPNSANVAISTPRHASTLRSAVPQRSTDESGLDRALSVISQLMAEGDYEQACMEWLQVAPADQGTVFERYFAKVDPRFVREVSPLMQLSLISVCSKDPDGPTIVQRLAYIEAILIEFAAIAETTDENTNEVTPRIMQLLVQRMETLFVRVNTVSPNDQMLRLISAIIDTAKRITQYATTSASNHVW